MITAVKKPPKLASAALMLFVQRYKFFQCDALFLDVHGGILAYITVVICAVFVACDVFLAFGVAENEAVFRGMLCQPQTDFGFGGLVVLCDLRGGKNVQCQTCVMLKEAAVGAFRSGILCIPIAAFQMNQQLGSAGTADPLNQRSTVGWKATKAAARLVEAFMIRIETASTCEVGEN